MGGEKNTFFYSVEFPIYQKKITSQNEEELKTKTLQIFREKDLELAINNREKFLKTSKIHKVKGFVFMADFYLYRENAEVCKRFYFRANFTNLNFLLNENLFAPKIEKRLKKLLDIFFQALNKDTNIETIEINGAINGWAKPKKDVRYFRRYLELAHYHIYIRREFVF